MKSIQFLLAIIMVTSLAGCAGFNVNEELNQNTFYNTDKIIIFPFKDPEASGKVVYGVGDRFTNAFSQASIKYGYNFIGAPSKFSSGSDVNISEAIDYAKQKDARFIITGSVSKWTDRATEWNFKRDFAGLAVTIREVPSGKIVMHYEVDQHSNNFWSGTPNDYVSSLSKKTAEKMFAKRK